MDKDVTAASVFGTSERTVYLSLGKRSIVRLREMQINICCLPNCHFLKNVGSTQYHYWRAKGELGGSCVLPLLCEVDKLVNLFGERQSQGRWLFASLYLFPQGECCGGFMKCDNPGKSLPGRPLIAVFYEFHERFVSGDIEILNKRFEL